jgi:hypothetical protein
MYGNWYQKTMKKGYYADIKPKDKPADMTGGMF